MKDITLNMKKFVNQHGLTILLLIIMAIPLFYKLGNDPIRMWDESRLSINAYEMHTEGNWIVTRYGGKPDMWNTKPPVMIWLQAVSMKLFGANELAVRLPSALAGIITMLMLMVFAGGYFNKKVLFIIAAFILITSPGYVGHHVTRTGDYDALLVLFTTLFNLCFFIFLENYSLSLIHI